MRMPGGIERERDASRLPCTEGGSRRALRSGVRSRAQLRSSSHPGQGFHDRTVKLGMLTRAGLDRLDRRAFSGRIASTWLQPGRYRAVFTAIDAAWPRIPPGARKTTSSASTAANPSMAWALKVSVPLSNDSRVVMVS
jgi:hypothetical protein